MLQGQQFKKKSQGHKFGVFFSPQKDETPFKTPNIKIHLLFDGQKYLTLT